MTSLHVSVPIACFRKGMAREYLETECLPPPATCYGMLLSLVGETSRRRHAGVRLTAGLLAETEVSVVLRTVWRVKSRPLGAPGNTRPDYQQLLTGASRQRPFIDLVIYVDSAEEADHTGGLEERIAVALDHDRRHAIDRFGGLSLGESTHMVDSISLTGSDALTARGFTGQRVFLQRARGRLSLPVWVDHVGSAGTAYVVGDLTSADLSPPPVEQIPRIMPTV